MVMLAGMARTSKPALLLLTLLLTGCATTSRPIPDASDPDRTANASQVPQILVNVDPGQIQEFDIVCALGGGHILPREDGYVLSSATSIRVTVSIDPTFTGMQIGWALDTFEEEARQVDVNWLSPPARAETRSYTIPIATDQYETPPKSRWSFYSQMNPGVEEACYTGGGSGYWTILVEAV